MNSFPPAPTQDSARQTDLAAPVLLYDGWCGFCASAVQFVLKHERADHRLLFAPLDGVLGSRIRRRFPHLATTDSMLLVLPAAGGADPRVLVRSAAAAALGRYLRGPWRFAAMAAAMIPRPIRDRAYDLVAKHRHRLRGNACLVPTADQRARFLD
jgi:predicted DCC family thiol-disulfide oxidoreductase YuxK